MKKTLIYILNVLFIMFSHNVYGQDGVLKDLKFSAGSKYQSRFTSYGIEMADESPAFGLNVSISHTSGFYSDASFISPVKSELDANQITIDIGYEKEISSFFSFSAEFNQYFFNNDTLSLLSGFSNSISLAADFSVDNFDIGVSLDQFLGETGATYFSFDLSRFVVLKPFYLLPIAQMVFFSQEVENQTLLKGKKGRKKSPNFSESEKVTLSGLANSIITFVTIYPVNKKISLSLIPSLIISHQDDLSANSTSFVWSFGLKYKFY